MGEFVADSCSDFHRLRSRVMFTLLVCVHLAFRILLDPIGVSADELSQWMGLTLMGFLMTQPVLFGMWAAFGTGAFFKRVPITLLALVAICFGGAIARWNLLLPTGAPNLLKPSEVVWELIFFAIATAVMLILRKLARWRIASESEAHRAVQPNQFSLKFLLGWTTICAVLLGIGRGLATTHITSGGSSWQESIGSIATFTGIILLTLFPVFLLPFIVLSVRPTLRIVFAIPLLWAALSWLAIECVAALESLPRTEAAAQVVALQVGAAIASLISATMLRLAGYRFFRQSRNGVAQPLPASGV